MREVFFFFLLFVRHQKPHIRQLTCDVWRIVPLVFGAFQVPGRSLGWPVEGLVEVGVEIGRFVHILGT